MAKVIERFGTSTTGGVITHDDRPSTYEAAERIAGRKLDRRKNYAIIDGEVCESCVFTRVCSGCSSDDPYVCEERGMGCDECGFTGKRIDASWIPISNTRHQPTSPCGSAGKSALPR